ncbi:hypothetical protein ACIBHX_07340 [Nonomuraea sp. NPDC050536]|uniref:hypothetical protein n=1 Tax=Nonomuraea sp. NPDC050536 TaxID=3364366 RepID=UPI0037CC41A5
MNYRVEFHVAALEQLKGLPSDAFDALVRRAVDLVHEPWDAHVLDPERPDIRETTFGAYGVLYFRLLEDDALIWIFSITWAG